MNFCLMRSFFLLLYYILQIQQTLPECKWCKFIESLQVSSDHLKISQTSTLRSFLMIVTTSICKITNMWADSVLWLDSELRYRLLTLLFDSNLWRVCCLWVVDTAACSTSPITFFTCPKASWEVFVPNCCSRKSLSWDRKWSEGLKR